MAGCVAARGSIRRSRQEGWRPARGVKGRLRAPLALHPSHPRRAAGCAPRLDTVGDRHFDKSAPLRARQLGPARYAALCQILSRHRRYTHTLSIYTHTLVLTAKKYTCKLGTLRKACTGVPIGCACDDEVLLKVYIAKLKG